MTSEQAKRDAIVKPYRAVHSGMSIKNILRYPKSTVNDDVKHYIATGSYPRKVHKPRSDKLGTPMFLAGLKMINDVKGSTCQNDLAQARNVSCRMIGRAINDDPKYKSFKLRVKHLPTDTMKAKRVVHCKKIINSLKSNAAGQNLRLFSDEKIFTLTGLSTANRTAGSAKTYLTCPWSFAQRTRPRSWSSQSSALKVMSCLCISSRSGERSTRRSILRSWSSTDEWHCKRLLILILAGLSTCALDLLKVIEARG